MVLPMSTATPKETPSTWRSLPRLAEETRVALAMI
jgi:hypothetical protein